MRNFWFKKNVGDWLKDPNLSLCSPAARGIWEDAICRMFELKSGALTGTYEQLSRSLRASAKEVELAFDELANTGTADLQRESNGVVTLICRRLQREFKKKQQTKLRVERSRSNAACNAPSNADETVQSKKLELETELDNNKTTACPPSANAPVLELSAEEPEQPKARDTVPHKEFVAAWNALGRPFKPVIDWTSKRQDMLRVRWGDAFFRENWRKALQVMTKTGWARGEGDRGWVADVEWFLKPGKALNLIEQSNERTAAAGVRFKKPTNQQRYDGVPT